MDNSFISNVGEALRSEGITFNGPLIEGVQRHNESLSDGKTVFIKVLGHTNTSDAFVREIGMAKLLSFAPRPLLEEPLSVDGRFITAWEYLDGKEVPSHEATEEDVTVLVQNLFEIYSTPIQSVRFHVGALNPEAIERRLNKAYQENRMPETLLKDVETIVQYHALDFLDSVDAKLMREDTLIHGDPHLGNLLKSSDGSTRLIDYESAKKAPIEYDLAAIFQNQSQLYERDSLWIASYYAFLDMASEKMERDIDKALLQKLILFKNAQSLTYLIAFGDWDIVSSRAMALLKSIKTNTPPERLQRQVGL